MQNKTRIEVYWDCDGNGWAWRYLDRSGPIGGDIGRDPCAARSAMNNAARSSVYSDRVLCMGMGQVADLDVYAVGTDPRD